MLRCRTERPRFRRRFRKTHDLATTLAPELDNVFTFRHAPSLRSGGPGLVLAEVGQAHTAPTATYTSRPSKPY